MSVVEAPTSEAIFDASGYDLPIPKIDGMRANKLSISFGGTLDRTNEDDLEELGKLTLLEEVTITVRAVVVGKSFTGKSSEDTPAVGYQVRLQVLGLEPH